LSALGIITVVTNEKQNLKDFYLTLAGQTYKDFTIYFVDNDSTDGSVEYFKELNKDNKVKTEYLQLKYNSGFSGGCNAGAEKAIKDGCKYLFFSNNDLVLDSKVMEEMIGLIKTDEKLAGVGPVLFKHSEKNPDEIQEYGGSINFKRGTLKKYYTNENVNNITLPETMETDFVGGGVCFIKADVFKKIGMFENSYFAYFDEIDLSYRLKVLNSYKMMVTSKAKIWHNHNWTRKNNNSYYFEYYLSERNKFLYYKKYKMYSSILIAWVIDSIKFPWRLIWFMKVCDFKLGLYYLKGMLDGLLGKKGKPNLPFIK
jgi:GT2 family glycosyltransferase